MTDRLVYERSQYVGILRRKLDIKGNNIRILLDSPTH